VNAAVKPVQVKDADECGVRRRLEHACVMLDDLFGDDDVADRQ